MNVNTSLLSQTSCTSMVSHKNARVREEFDTSYSSSGSKRQKVVEVVIDCPMYRLPTDLFIRIQEYLTKNEIDVLHIVSKDMYKARIEEYKHKLLIPKIFLDVIGDRSIMSFTKIMNSNSPLPPLAIEVQAKDLIPEDNSFPLLVADEIDPNDEPLSPVDDPSLTDFPEDLFDDQNAASLVPLPDDEFNDL